MTAYELAEPALGVSALPRLELQRHVVLLRADPSDVAEPVALVLPV